MTSISSMATVCSANKAFLVIRSMFLKIPPFRDCLLTHECYDFHLLQKEISRPLEKIAYGLSIKTN